MPSARLYIVRHGETNENRTGIIQGHRDTLLNEAGLSQAAVVAGALENLPLTEAWSSDLQRAVKTAQIVVEKHPGIKLSTTKALRERDLGALEGAHLSQRVKILREFPNGIDPSAEGVDAMKKRTMAWWDTEVLGLTSKPVPQTPLANEKRFLAWWDSEVQKLSSEHVSPAPPANGNLNGNSVVHHDVQPTSDPTLNHNPPDVHHVLIVSHGGFIGGLVKNLLATNRVESLDAPPMNGSSWTCHNTSITRIDVSEDGKGTLIKYADTSHMLEAVKQGKVATRNADVSQEGMDAISGGR